MYLLQIGPNVLLASLCYYVNSMQRRFNLSGHTAYGNDSLFKNKMPNTCITFQV